MKISVVIITRNRKEQLKETINSYLGQEYPNKEVIVVDNASNDGTKEMMPAEFPDVRYLWLPDNFDIRSINIAVDMAEGDIIWRCDDDSYPESEKAFGMAVEIFKKYPDIHIIATEDVEARKNNTVWHWYPYTVDKQNVPDDGYRSHYFHGTGAAIRKEVFEKIGGFWEFGYEEIDFCTRAILEDYNIRYFPNIRTLHFSTSANEQKADRFVKLTTQFVRYTWKYFPFFSAVWRTFIYTNLQVFIALGRRVPLGGILETLFRIPAVIIAARRNERQLVPKEKIEDITLGVSFTKTQWNYFKEVIKRNIGIKK